MVKFLLDNNANTESKGRWGGSGGTHLHAAVRYSKEAMAKLLLTRRPNVDAQDEKGGQENTINTTSRTCSSSRNLSLALFLMVILTMLL